MEVEVYDGLDSTDPTLALSARQGNILLGMIEGLGSGGGGSTTIEFATEAEIDAIFA